MLDSLIVGDHTGQAYSRVFLTIDLYFKTRISLYWPQEVPASALRMLTLDFAFVTCVLTCAEKEYIVSKWTPKSFGCLSRFTGLHLMKIS